VISAKHQFPYRIASRSEISKLRGVRTIRSLVVLLAVLVASCSASSEPAATASSVYASTKWDESAAWAEDAMAYALSGHWNWENPSEAARWTQNLAYSTCLALSEGESPAVVEANFRSEMPMGAWVNHGGVWWDSLVNDHCIRR